MTVPAVKNARYQPAPPPSGDIDGETRVYTRRSAVESPRGSFCCFYFGLEIKFALTRTRITRRQLLRQAGATGALALSASGLATGEALQDRPAAASNAATATPKTESQAAEKYAHPPG